MSNFFTVCVGEVGAGKSAFINSVLKYGNKQDFCESRSDWKGVTKELDEKFITKGNKHFYFYDTPGLNEANLSEEMIKLLKKEMSGDIERISRIRCILIIMKITDYRLTNDMQNIIIELMNTFPSPNFWEHVLVIRTHCFDESQINNIQGNIEQIIREDPKIKETMDKKGIKLPKEINEFYVNSVDENGNYNSNKIGDILEKISTKDPLYQNIKYSDIKERREGKIIIKYKIMTFQDFGKDESHSVEIQTDVIGADETIFEKVGSPYKRNKDNNNEIKKEENLDNIIINKEENNKEIENEKINDINDKKEENKYNIINEDNNYIIAEINIKDKDVGKKIRIINSFEKYKRNHYTGWIKEEDYYKYENEKEIKDNCKIKINNNDIDFNYYNEFKEK